MEVYSSDIFLLMHIPAMSTFSNTNEQTADKCEDINASHRHYVWNKSQTQKNAKHVILVMQNSRTEKTNL